MNFEEEIGKAIFIYLKYPIVTPEMKEPLRGIGANLIGLESSGVWIESDQLYKIHESEMWDTELEFMGPEAVGTISMNFFVPFESILFAFTLSPRLGE